MGAVFLAPETGTVMAVAGSRGSRLNCLQIREKWRLQPSSLLSQSSRVLGGAPSDNLDDWQRSSQAPALAADPEMLGPIAGQREPGWRRTKQKVQVLSLNKPLGQHYWTQG